jgi:hypothetical protein
MPLYNVHLRPELTIKVVDIEADSQLEALEKAESMLWGYDSHIIEDIRRSLKNVHGRGVDYVELAEDLHHALVDRQGDDLFNESTWYTCEQRSAWEPMTFKEDKPDGCAKDV